MYILLRNLLLSIVVISPITLYSMKAPTYNLRFYIRNSLPKNIAKFLEDYRNNPEAVNNAFAQEANASKNPVIDAMEQLYQIEGLLMMVGVKELTSRQLRQIKRIFDNFLSIFLSSKRTTNEEKIKALEHRLKIEAATYTDEVYKSLGDERAGIIKYMLRRLNQAKKQLAAS